MSKNAIVTGAAGNMGTAVVKQLLQDEFKVLGTILEGEDCGENAHHSAFESYIADVTNEEACRNMVQHATQQMGDIHLAALLVGGFSMGSFADTNLEDVQQMFKLNFESAFVSARAVYQQMRQQSSGGKIILVGAKPALEKGGSAGLTAYAFSKSLIFKLAEHINTEGKDHKITASVIVPSILDTPPNRNAMPDADFADWVSPSDIAGVISFIASEKASPLRDPVFRVYGDA